MLDFIKQSQATKSHLSAPFMCYFPSLYSVRTTAVSQLKKKNTSNKTRFYSLTISEVFHLLFYTLAVFFRLPGKKHSSAF